MTEGVQQDYIIRAASDKQLCALAPVYLRSMLDTVRQGVGDMKDEKQKRKLLEECVDFFAIANDDKSLKAFVEILSCKDLLEKFPIATKILAQLASAPHAKEEKLIAALRGNKKAILNFLKFSAVAESPNEDNETKLIKPVFGLYYYQLMSVRNIYAQLNEGKGRVMFHAPTGTGKTRMAMSVVSRHLREFGPTAVLWVASGHELVSQAGNAFSEAWKFHGDTPCQLRAWHGDNPHFVPQDAPEINTMLITSLQKLAAAARNFPNVPSLLRKRVSLIVFDEAHQAVAPVYQSLIKEILEEGNVRLLGLSATPGRSDDDETAKLVEFFNCKKAPIWRPQGRGLIEYLVEKGYLAEAKFIPINMGGKSPSTPMTDARANTEEFDSETLNRIGESVERNFKIVETCKKALKNGHARVLVFTPSVAAAHFCKAALKATFDIEDGCCEAVDAKTPLDMRKTIVRRYKDKMNQKFVIFNYNVMTTGVDVPSTSALVIGRPTKSVSQYAQMVGRAVRGAKSGGNSKADIYTVVDSDLPAFCSVAASFENWNELWKEQNHEQK